MARRDPARRAERSLRSADGRLHDHGDKAAFDELTTGRTNAMAAAPPERAGMDGDPRLLVRFQRLFPAPTGMPETAGHRSVGKRRG